MLIIVLLKIMHVHEISGWNFFLEFLWSDLKCRYTRPINRCVYLGITAFFVQNSAKFICENDTVMTT